MTQKGCCAPSRDSGGGHLEIADINSPPENTSLEDMVLLPGGEFLMGSDDKSFPEDGEGPVRAVTLDPFYIDVTTVTNAQFAEFVAATGYVTEAERFGWSFVFMGFLPADFPPTRALPEAPWWRQVFGSQWRYPEGPDSSIADRMNHPVVHVSWNDAVVFARWAGKRLPTEAEWEYAGRGGLKQKTFPWGNRMRPDGKHQCNTWQGKFPVRNTGGDGYVGTSPVDAFKPNGFGLYNTCGNVWEWCADWFSPTYHQRDRRHNPLGPPAGQMKVTKGGSYMCHKSYCNRYRNGARTGNTPDSSTDTPDFGSWPMSLIDRD